MSHHVFLLIGGAEWQPTLTAGQRSVRSTRQRCSKESRSSLSAKTCWGARRSLHAGGRWPQDDPDVWPDNSLPACGSRVQLDRPALL